MLSLGYGRRLPAEIWRLYALQKLVYQMQLGLYFWADLWPYEPTPEEEREAEDRLEDAFRMTDFENDQDPPPDWWVLNVDLTEIEKKNYTRVPFGFIMYGRD